MKDIRLTTRGKIVVGILIAVALTFFYWKASEIITPQECQVPIVQMSDSCKALL